MTHFFIPFFILIPLKTKGEKRVRIKKGVKRDIEKKE
jgi:hypothetical protein